ncbi:hypothetical protein DS745_16225 [Anaerobacillus alkaliphilus]|uniref:Dipeptidylpeptidase IV N-terminal domain-containing protein n=1 Tax=Anaerobacillus alkaliphilus TaxID=1548597 RepID=A0A4Q0VR87_9BACI|nr:PD40 domain-containing protein [Anaerobacillus alkaliphilus]RXI97900.1 hypothetical protein DS745_16225 [Anaerobacillus alkaliphilus]
MRVNIEETELIAYTSGYYGSFDIYVLDVLNGENVRLTYELADYFTVPYWCKESSKIAFVGKDLFLYVVDITSKEIIRIDQLVIGEEHSLSWSYKGDRLAYTKQNQIMIYNTATHKMHKIIERSPTNVQWFPDDTTLLYQSSALTGTSQLFRISIDQTSIQQLTINEGGTLTDVRLSPDGQFVIYRKVMISSSAIFSMDILSGQVYEIEGSSQDRSYFPEWSLDSKKIAYSQTSGFWNGYSSSIRTVGRHGENDQGWVTTDCYASPITWSPDSKKLVYLSGCKSGYLASEMWYIDLIKPIPLNLISGRFITSVKWSPTKLLRC